MGRVSIYYKDGTTVEANNLADALNHLAAVGTDELVDIREDPPPPGPCKHCDGTGHEKRDDGKRVMTRKQAEDAVSEIRDAGSDPDRRHAAARNLTRN